jgi:dipeptidyl aminopeptidase/acylaminoacyl peptidase
LAAARVGRVLVILTAIAVIFRMTGCMEHLFYHPIAGRTPAPDLPNAEVVRFDSRDGTRLCGWFIPAIPEPAGTPAPTVLHVHGNAGNMNDHLGFTAFLPAAGFNLFIFDYRGYGESEGAARRRAPLIDDAHAALDHLLSRDDVDPQRIALYGQSLGGSIGLNMMAQRPEIRCALIESAFTSWRDIAADAVGGGNPGPISKSLAWLLIGDSHRADDAIRTISKSGRNILILHGDADSIIPVKHGRALKDAGGERVRLIQYAGGDHNTLRDTHPEMEKDVVEFLRSELSSPATRPSS